MSHDQDAARRAHARVGTLLREKYLLTEVLGSGGMGVVYGATHRPLRSDRLPGLRPVGLAGATAQAQHEYVARNATPEARSVETGGREGLQERLSFGDRRSPGTRSS